MTEIIRASMPSAPVNFVPAPAPDEVARDLAMAYHPATVSKQVAS